MGEGKLKAKRRAEALLARPISTSPSSIKLAAALREAGLDSMAKFAEHDYYHDFKSPLDTPCLQLAHDLQNAYKGGVLTAKEVLDRHLNGEFDAGKAESDEWAQSEDGQDAFRRLLHGKGS